MVTLWISTPADGGASEQKFIFRTDDEWNLVANQLDRIARSGGQGVLNIQGSAGKFSFLVNGSTRLMWRDDR